MKLSILVFIQTIIATFKLNVTRWIIKNLFSRGEIPLGKWYSLEFLLSLNIPKILGLIIIASFTLITFPLGVWIASFKLGYSFPIMNMLGFAIQFITFPINIFIMNTILVEMAINNKTVFGIIIIEISKILGIIGCWLLYIGNKGVI